MSLSKLLKKIKVIHTNLGEFEFEKSSGNGGNSSVFIFKRTCNNISKSYAIKFLKSDISTKGIQRFKDEFFLTQQIPTHTNIAQYYHLDKVFISSDNETYEYYIIIMKLYETTLKNIEQNIIFDENHERELKKIFCNLIDGLEHLHNQGFIHRDIKPENILYDKEKDCYVIADMGITKFSDDLPKLAETEKSDRMANWSFSPKEQLNSKNPPEKNWDIFALGQVIHWFVTGETIRGSNNRFNIFGNYKSNFCNIINQFIIKSTDNNPDSRFQSIKEVKDFVTKKAQEIKNRNFENSFFQCFDDFDNIIRKNFSKINDIYEETDLNKINRFISDFNLLITKYNNHFWAMDLVGGDLEYKQPIIDINNNLKLFWGYIEINIEKIIIYRNRNDYTRNFFILINKQAERFPSDNNSYDMGISRYWIEKDIYVNYNDTINGYYEDVNGNIIDIDQETFPERHRYHKPYAFMIGLQGTPISMGILSRELISHILQQAIDGNLNIETINHFERATSDDFVDFIKNRR